MVKLSKEAKQRLQQLFKGGQFAIRWGFIPLVIYLGFKRGADPGMPEPTVLRANKLDLGVWLLSGWNVWACFGVKRLFGHLDLEAISGQEQHGRICALAAVRDGTSFRWSPFG
ncbi:mitochondrial import receptor subunit TOM7 homolog [Nycticebus coucang]|uniref:mitochondrial import receptor subunit TOM7 homolog n=1 Tax=Nycticebus coucang TaxID=9470 RepID=UPI00234D4EFA|nr:mitochondrial import receptor subunit TOM7 homolog [Nycticebus coucang]